MGPLRRLQFPRTIIIEEHPDTCHATPHPPATRSDRCAGRASAWRAFGLRPAAEQQKEILDALRAKGHYDEAVDYLQHARTNSAMPKAFVETIDYELAVTRIDAAAGLAETRRDQPLRLAQESLTKFLAEQPQHALAAAARSQLGNVLLDRGRLQRTLAEQYEGAARQKYLETARGLLRQADEQWAGIDKTADEELKKIVPVRGAELKQSQARDQIHRRQLQARLGRAWAQYEMGQTWAAGSRGAARPPWRRRAIASTRFPISSSNGWPISMPGWAAAFAGRTLARAARRSPSSRGCLRFPMNRLISILCGERPRCRPWRRRCGTT